MAEDNGNGYKALDIDVTDEVAFKTAVVQHLQLIVDQTRVIPRLQKTVAKHESAYQFLVWMGALVVGIISLGIEVLVAWWKK